MSNTNIDPFDFDEEDEEPRKRVVSNKKNSKIVPRSRKKKSRESRSDNKTRKRTSKIVPRSKKTVVSAFIGTPKRKVTTIGLDGNTPVQEKLFEPSPKKAFPWGHGLKRRASTKKKKKRKSKKAKSKKTPTAPRKLSANQRSQYMSSLTPERLRYMNELSVKKHKKTQHKIHKSMGRKSRVLSPIRERSSRETSNPININKDLLNEFNKEYIPKKPKKRSKKSKGCVGRYCSSKRSNSG
jgi:hypothetical protein